LVAAADLRVRTSCGCALLQEIHQSWHTNQIHQSCVSVFVFDPIVTDCAEGSAGKVTRGFCGGFG
jgi:hypothetical protein